MYYYSAASRRSRPHWYPDYSCCYKSSAMPCVCQQRKVKDAEEELREKQYESFLRIIDDFPVESYRDSQITSNLRIVLSPSIHKRSLRFTVAVYRLIELGVDADKLSKFFKGKTDARMRWYKVKKALCLSDSSCGLREFFL